jgi:hypothetical protein
MSTEQYIPHEPHPWADLTPEQVLDQLTNELYTPVSALGSEVDRLASGAFEDDELLVLLDRIRENLDALGRLVVTLKRYTTERDTSATARERSSGA